MTKPEYVALSENEDGEESSQAEELFPRDGHYLSRLHYGFKRREILIFAMCIMLHSIILVSATLLLVTVYQSHPSWNSAIATSKSSRLQLMEPRESCQDPDC